MLSGMLRQRTQDKARFTEPTVGRSCARKQAPSLTGANRKTKLHAATSKAVNVKARVARLGKAETAKENLPHCTSSSSTVARISQATSRHRWSSSNLAYRAAGTSVVPAAAEYRPCSAVSRDGVASVAHHQERHFAAVACGRGITPRSSGAPTAGHQARSGGTRYIFATPGLASCRCRPLSSNVRPGEEQNSRARLAVAAMGCAGTASSHGIAVRFGNRRSAHGFGMYQGTHPVRSESSPQK